MNTDKVGRDLWVVQHEGDWPTVSRYAKDHRGFLVYPQKQTGPERWENDLSAQPIEMATTGTVLSVASYAAGNPSVFNVRLDDGREVALDSLQFVVFDYRTCDPATLLNNRGDYRLAKQWMWYLPLKLKPGARPLDRSGDWIDESYLEQISMLDCTSYNYYTALHPNQFNCVAIWKDDATADPRGLDMRTPRDIYATSEMLEHATIEDLKP